MLALLKGWQGSVEINGTMYDDMSSAIKAFKPTKGEVHIRLVPQGKKSETADSSNAIQQVDALGELKVTVKQYMTKPASPEFDFMAKWNNNKPMPLRTMVGKVIKETRGMVYMQLHGYGMETICCMRCGRDLTHPVSRHYGIGPECRQKIGMFCDIEDIDGNKEELVKITWEGWIIKSAILTQEEI